MPRHVDTRVYLGMLRASYGLTASSLTSDADVEKKKGSLDDSCSVNAAHRQRKQFSHHIYNATRRLLAALLLHLSLVCELKRAFLLYTTHPRD